jgi:hypothetical protein
VSPPYVGTTTAIEVSIQGDENLPYVMALAFSDTPPTLFPDGNVVPIHLDDLTAYSLVSGNPVLPHPIGIMDANGRASSPLFIPPLPALSGLTIYATAMTLDMPTFPLLRTVFPKALPIPIL